MYNKNRTECKFPPKIIVYCKVSQLHLFVCLFIATRGIFQLSGGFHHCRWKGRKFRPMLGAQGHWAGRDLYRVTPTATWDLGLYGLIRKTGTIVPQDHQIFARDVLTTEHLHNSKKCVIILSCEKSDICCICPQIL
jgi:hypothetical protein